MFSLYRDGAKPSTFATQSVAIDAGRASGAQSFEIYDEDHGAVVYQEFPSRVHLRY